MAPPPKTTWDHRRTGVRELATIVTFACDDDHTGSLIVLARRLAVGELTFLELLAQVPRLVRSAPVLLGVRLGISAGERLALSELLRQLATLELLHNALFVGHTRDAIRRTQASLKAA